MNQGILNQVFTVIADGRVWAGTTGSPVERVDNAGTSPAIPLKTGIEPATVAINDVPIAGVTLLAQIANVAEFAVT